MAVSRTATLIRKGLYLLQLLVLGFWIGGGLVAGGIVPFYIQRSFPQDPAAAGNLVGGILLRFSTAGAIAGAALFALLFWLERGSRKTLLALGALVVLAVVNEYIVASWMRGSTGSNYEALHTTYVVLFATEVLLALALFIAASLRGPPVRETEPLAPPPPFGAAGHSA